jgi:dynein heavy chain 2
LELAVRVGKTLVIQDVTRIEPILYPLLRGEIVGQKVDCNPGFCLCMVTGCTSSVVAADERSLMTIINSTTTRAGLMGQLLGKAFRLEIPDLETRKGREKLDIQYVFLLHT